MSGSWSATFRGGPISGRSIHGLSRTPTLLRVVQDDGHDRYDVLNDLADRVRHGEDVVAVYVLDDTTAGSNSPFVDYRGSGGVSGRYVTYVHLPVLRPEALADAEAWVDYLAAVFNTTREVVLARRETLRREG